MSAASASRDLRATAVRAQIEASLSRRFAGALTPSPRQVRETLGTGVEALDTMLGGGVPVGAITELAGPMSSGRTTVALRTVASAMREGNLCAWVDANDALDPESAAANGVCLQQLLWVRCGVQPAKAASSGTQAAGSGRMEATANAGRAGWHPRDEVRGLDLAVGELLREREGESPRRDRSIGTPGAPNRSLTERGEKEPVAGGRVFSPVRRSEQAPSDRQPSRRAIQNTRSINTPDTPLAGGEPGSGRLDHLGDLDPAQPPPRRFAEPARSKPWARLDQALRAADLLLQGAGFRVLVLDLGSIAPEHCLRIPLATWFRFRAAADQGRTVLLLLTQASCAKSSAGLVLQMEGLEPEVSLPVLEGIRYRARPLRQRFSGPDVSGQGASLVSMDRFGDRLEGRAGDRWPTQVEGQAGPRRQPHATWQLSAYSPSREGRLA